MTNGEGQHMTALARANEVRVAAAQARRDVAANKLSLNEALHDERAGSLPVLTLLMAQWQWGHNKAHKVLRAAGVGEGRRVRDLTPHQRDRILRAAQGSPRT